VKGLGLFHVGARQKGGAFGSMDLSNQLSSAPQLFHTLARAVLALSMGSGSSGGSGGSGGGGEQKRLGGTALHPSLVAPAAEALLACICAEPAAFQGAAEALLGAHAGTHGAALAARLAAELTELTTVHVTRGGVRARVALVLGDQAVRQAFTSNFEDFVTKMAGVMTIL